MTHPTGPDPGPTGPGRTLAEREGYLYVVEFISGVVKVGKAWNAERRIACHAQSARIHGGDIARSWASERHPDYHTTECQLIDYCKQHGEQAFGREYFRSIERKQEEERQRREEAA